MKQPNRKFKVPHWIMVERCLIAWLSVFRVRAACEAIFGYDPGMENFDQSPYHHNETGSKNVGTVAVAGMECPLVEGHADTRSRWTGNFTTFSEKSRILAGEMPYVEAMFKSNADSTTDGRRMTLELRVREHIRSRGYGPWITVATSPRGSYREADVLNFLERHLPKWEEGRRWRIMLADDFSAHLTSAVFRLCWQRGYVFIPLGGGTTGVQQTVDLQLNQHVRRKYTAEESVELIDQMRAGVSIPRCTPEKCVDILVEVMSSQALHLHAADSYEQAGWTVPLDDSSRDIFIVKEAGAIWRSTDARTKVNAAVAAVRSEVSLKRLQWNPKHVSKLIGTYPPKNIDKALKRLGDDAFVGEGCDSVRDLEGEGAASEGEGEDQAGDEECDEDAETVLKGFAEDACQDADRLDDACGEEAATEPGRVRGGSPDPAVAEVAPCLEDEEDQELARSRLYLATLADVKEQLESVGAMQAASTVERNIRAEQRRLRAHSREHPAVLTALGRARDEAAAADAKRRRLVADLHQDVMTKKKLKEQIAEADSLLTKKKKEIAAQEQIAEAKHAVKQFSLKFLGDGAPQGGKVSGRKNRHEVLDRLSRLGTGLSPEQRNDWPWFKAEWDRAMLTEHKAAWPKVFATWMQRVLDDLDHGNAHAFSFFVHSETRRCLDDQPGLQVPGMSGRQAAAAAATIL